MVKKRLFHCDHLDEDQIDFLLELQSAGHEIGAHGISHQDYGIHLENGGTDMTQG